MCLVANILCPNLVNYSTGYASVCNMGTRQKSGLAGQAMVGPLVWALNCVLHR